MYPLTKTPTQEPLQEAELLPDRTIAHLAYLSKVVHILRQPSLVEKGEAEVCSERSKMNLHCSELLIGGVRPVVLSTTDSNELIKGFVELCRSIGLIGSLLRFYVVRPIAALKALLTSAGLGMTSATSKRLNTS